MDNQASGGATVAERPMQTSTDANTSGTPSQSPTQDTTPASGEARDSGGSQSDTSGGAGTTGAPVDEAQHWEWLRTRDPREVVRQHRQLASYVGTETDRRARELEPVLRQRWETETDFARMRDELRDLRDGPNADPEAYVAKERELEGKINEFNAREAKAQAEQAQQWGNFDNLLHQVYGALPEGVRAKLAGRTWDLGHPALSRQAYLNDMLNELTEHASTDGATKKFEKELPRRLREMEEGLRKQANGETNGGGPGLDNGAGTPSPRGVVSQDDWDRAKGRGKVEFRAWRQANKEGIQQGLARKLIYRE